MVQKSRHVCAKIKYKSSREAKTAKRRINDRKTEQGDARMLLSHYRCPDCKFWHLSSMSFAKQSHIQIATISRLAKRNPGIELVNKRLNFLLKKKK